jgi:membrane-associated phospholipid phosphatase
VKRQWVRVLAVSYPLLTLFAIIVTGNHYWLDAAGGALILGLGSLAGFLWANRGRPAEVMLET